MKLTFCVACGSTDDLQHHHLVMVAEGGSDDESNLITLCSGCHAKLHARQQDGTYSHSQRIKNALAAKRAQGGSCGGRKPLAELRPEVAALAREMHGQRMSLRQISAALAEQGHLTGGGRPYSANAVQGMLRGG